MISHEHHCIFVHIPKAAGTSIETAFGHLDGHAGREGQDHRTFRMMLWPSLALSSFSSVDNVKEVIKATVYPFTSHPNARNRVSANKHQIEQYFKFTVVRNPWARAFSWYQNVKRDAEHQRLLGVDADIDFKTFFKRFRGRGMLKPQTHWLKDFDGKIPMDYICRFESLQQDFSVACKRMGIDEIQLPHALKGSGKHYADFYDAETKALADETYADDIELFGYQFGDKS